MRPRRTRRLLTLAGFGAIIAAATIGTGVAKAAPLDDYVVTNAPLICSTLDAYPTVAGVEGVMMAIIDHGLTPRQAGEVVGRSVIGFCPDHAPEVNGFIQKWAPAGQVMS